MLIFRQRSRVQFVEAHLLLGVALLRRGLGLGWGALAVLLGYRVDIVFLRTLLG